MNTIQLGDEVEDIVTGFRGIVIGRHEFLYGIPTVSVQPIMEHYGILQDYEIFAEVALRVIKTKDKPKPVIVK